MHTIAKHICTAKHLLTMCLLLFALSSCAVKESLLGLVQTDYTKPTNRSQTTSHNGFCSYTVATGKEASVVNHSKIKYRKETELLTANFVGIFSNKSKTSYFKTFSGNSPPKYILYKRLKLHIV